MYGVYSTCRILNMYFTWYSIGATASPVVKALPDPPPGILKKKPGRKHLGGMVQWMSWHDSGMYISAMVMLGCRFLLLPSSRQLQVHS